MLLGLLLEIYYFSLYFWIEIIEVGTALGFVFEVWIVNE